MFPFPNGTPAGPAARARILALFAVALAAVALLAPAGALATPHLCVAGETACLDSLPAEGRWRPAIGLDAVPNSYQGDGVAVASIDTGVTPNPNLGARLLARADLSGEGDGLDRFGHGTHMAGLIASDGTTSQEAFEGAAPETNLVSVKVAGWDGATDVSTVIAGLRWVVSNRERYGIRVVSLSWGTDAMTGYGDDPLDLAVERAWRAGLVVVVSAGNGGPASGTVTKPADDPYVIAVGAADTNGTADRADDTVAPFSSRGPTVDGIGKPDLLAPGVSLVSDRAPGSTVDAFRPLARVRADLFKGSGTSQAAAVVAGVAARMLDADPRLTNDQVKGILLATADPRLAGPGGGAGTVDAKAALAVVAAARREGAPLPPAANAGLVPSTGRGAIDTSRGTQRVYTDLDGDRVADPVTGEVDALGRAWDAAAYADEAWTPETWSASPWAPLAAEASAGQPRAATGIAAPMVAWEARYWGAASWPEAGWDARYWGARYWGARYWGTGLWQ
ncbi:MAG: serine protease AprX [Solirubrobacteraceae bacterium]|nr:serine protease AprX [Solirubrobacteraceae bacterium]